MHFKRFSNGHLQSLAIGVTLIVILLAAPAHAGRGWWDTNIEPKGSVYFLPDELLPHSGGNPTVQVVNHTAVVTCSTITTQTTTHLITVDITNPATPILKGDLQIEGPVAENITLKTADGKGYLLLGSSENQMTFQILDLSSASGASVLSTTTVSDPNNPPAGFPSNGTVRLNQIEVIGSYAYVAVLYNWFFYPMSLSECHYLVYNVSNPAAPSFVATLPVTFNDRSIVRLDATHIAFAKAGHFAVYDVSSPLSPALVRDYEWTDIPVVTASDGSMIVGDTNTLYDISNPSAIKRLCKYESAGWIRALREGFAFAISDRGICVLDVSQPESLDFMRGFYLPPSRVNDLAIDGDVICAVQDGRLITLRYIGERADALRNSGNAAANWSQLQ